MRRFLVTPLAVLAATLGGCAVLSAPAFAIGTIPSGLALSPNDATLYATNFNSVEVIDTATNQSTATIDMGSAQPSALALSPDGGTLYIASLVTNTVSVIDTATDQVRSTIPVGNQPYAEALSPDGGTLYVANYADGTISVIDTRTDQVTTTIAGADNPRALAISPSGDTLYVADAPGRVLVIDTATDEVSTTINIDESAVALALSPDGSKLYVANQQEAVISVVNTATDSDEDDIDDDSDQPYALALGADGNVLYAAGYYNPGVAPLDTATDAWGSTLSVSELASSLIVDPTTGTLYGNPGIGLGPTATSVQWEGTAAISLPGTESAPSAGQTLTATPNGWLPMDELTYQWFADGQAISGATSPTLALSSAQVGEQISVEVTGDAGTQMSAATAAVTPAPSPPPQQTTTSTTPTPSTTTEAPTASPTHTTTAARHPKPKAKPKRRPKQRLSVRVAGVADGATYFGAAPDPRCVVQASYGRARCRISSHTTRHGSRTAVTYTAHATGNAGTSATASVTVKTTAVRLHGLHERHGVFIGKLGGTYMLEVASRAEPLYVDAAVAPALPRGTHAWFRRAGTLNGLPLWRLPVYLPAGLADFRLWQIGIELGGQMQVITIRT